MVELLLSIAGYGVLLLGLAIGIAAGQPPTGRHRRRRPIPHQLGPQLRAHL